MSVARLELVLRMLGGVLAGAAAWEVGRNQVTSSIPVLSSWPYLTFIVLCLLVIASFAVAFALAGCGGSSCCSHRCCAWESARF